MQQIHQNEIIILYDLLFPCKWQLIPKKYVKVKTLSKERNYISN